VVVVVVREVVLRECIISWYIQRMDDRSQCGLELESLAGVRKKKIGTCAGGIPYVSAGDCGTVARTGNKWTTERGGGERSRGNMEFGPLVGR
jgi:hypothetical protein